MRILVFSDTHGRVQSAMDLYTSLEQEQHIDLVVHLGDLLSDARALETRLQIEVRAVKGNCDGSDFREDESVLETEFGRILLCHGHLEQVDFGLSKLCYRAQEMDCKAAFFGHTHKPCYVYENGIYLLNPGSLTKPRGGTVGSYAVVTTEKKEMQASVLFYEPKPKVSGGYLKDLLNNSQRAYDRGMGND